MNYRLVTGFVVLALAYVLLVPGLVSPILNLEGRVDKADLIKLGKDLVNEDQEIPGMFRSAANMMLDRMNAEGSIQAYQKERSILGTIQNLFESGNRLVAILIMVFSIIVPVTKGLLLLIANLPVSQTLRKYGLNISGMVSKWSMADVFVVAVIVAFLAGNANPDTNEMLKFNATLGSGFYYFLAYCLLSILSAQLLTAKSTVTPSPDPCIES